MTHTGNPLDLALGSNGFFTVQSPRGPRLTRAGHYELSSTGSIVDADGDALLDTTGKPMLVGATDGTLTVTGDGTLSGANGQIGKIGVVAPADQQKMQAEGSRLFAAQSPTTPLVAPKISQGLIEESNVQPSMELNRMMNELREFQYTSQFIQSESDRQQGAIDKLMQKRS
jgi:flagellar basal-body rod protein FlgF